MMVPGLIHKLLASAAHGPVVALTGAGVSAESGIPTFRGPGGYWQVGSKEYRAEELATHAAFSRMPDEVWAWYLYRRGVCRAAEPNPGHRALADLERALGNDFTLVTQNVDGLHARAGSSVERTFEIHGQIELYRCARECSPARFRIPEAVDPAWPKTRKLTDADRALLACPRCGGPGRPHVLWFDETYDEPRYRARSAMEAAERAELLVVCGTSGATNLPHQMVRLAAQQGAAIVVLNVDPSPFSEIAESSTRGAFWPGPSAETLPASCAALLAARA